MIAAENSVISKSLGSYGADRLLQALLERGVNTCFANPGTSEMHLVAALDRTPRMRCVLTLFENVATGAADGYARMLDRPALTLLHLGPGLTNGLANLHNARRAGTPVLNLIGDYTESHITLDAPLNSDIAGVASPMSNWVGRIVTANQIDACIEQAWRASMRPGVATLIVPSDVAWSQVDDADTAPTASPEPGAHVADSDREDTQTVVKRIARAVAEGKRIGFLLSGRALREESLKIVAAIAAATGAPFYARGANARIDRGGNRPPIDRLPYAYERGAPLLKSVELLIQVDAAAPTTFFPYPGQPPLLTVPGCEHVELCGKGEDAAAALRILAERLGVSEPFTAPNLSPAHSVPTDPISPDTPLTAAIVNRIVAEHLPEQAIVCDESLTSDGFYALSHNAPEHSFLQLTGGALGIGLPLGLGAAIACPDRRVIVMQADGSGMYTLQALWTMAREQTDVTAVIFANRAYAILQNEMRKVGVTQIGETARQMMSLENPALNWVSLAEGMGVEAARAQTAGDFLALWKAAIARRGPFLIEALV